jgi:hypothetical protein
MKLYNRDSIAADIKNRVFAGKDVWSFIFPDVREGLRFVATGGPAYSDKRLFEKMEGSVAKKVSLFGASLKSIYFVENGRRKTISYKNAQEHMGRIMRNKLPVIFKIMLKNKYYEYKVKH